MLKKIKKHYNQKTLVKTSIRAIMRTLSKRSSILKKCIKKINRINLEFKGAFTQSIIYKPFEIVYVPVESINHMVADRCLRFSEYLEVRIVGMISNSDWDIYSKEKFNNSPTFTAFKSRFLEKKEWEDTSYYEHFYKINKMTGLGWRKCKTWPEFKEKKLKEWDELYKHIEKDGYKKQITPEREIEVGISRNGEILFIDGRHRLAIAKLLKLEVVPVIVNLWHKQYIERVLQNTNNKRITPSDAIKPALKIKQPQTLGKV